MMKYLQKADNDDLIETYWDVKTIAGIIRNESAKDLIETYWDVKVFWKVLSIIFMMADLIETYWDVKTDTAISLMCKELI